MTDEREHRRRSTRLKGYDYTSAGGYFITVVAFRRECLFGEVLDGQIRLNWLGEIVEDCWEEIPSHFQNVDIDEFVVMPNHVHGIVFKHPMNNVEPFQHIVIREFAQLIHQHKSPLRDHCICNPRNHPLNTPAAASPRPGPRH